MSQSQTEGNSFDCGQTSSTSFETGSSSGGGGDDPVGGPDVFIIKNESGAVECSPVFTNKLIIEKLVLYSIHDSRGNISPRMVGVVRAVQKSWLDVTTAVLKKLEEPVITLDESNMPSNTKSLSNENLKTLEKFSEVFSDPERLHRSFLPYEFIMDQESFREENYKTVLDCLSSIGAELVELEITYPTDKVGIPRLSFPSLRKLTFNFTWMSNDKYNAVCSLQCILDGCQRLVKLAIDQKFGDKVQTGIKFLSLPDTLVSLEVGLKLNSQELEALALQLTKLEYLKVTLQRTPYQDGLLFKILNRFRKTLKRFKVFNFWWDRRGETVPRTYLQFPVMEKLETLHIDSTECELGLGPWSDSGIEQFLPKLNRLLLYFQTEAMLAKWLDNFKSDKMKVMGICVINEQLQSDDDHFILPIKTEMLAQVKNGFPNLQDLSLDLNFGDMNVLKYLFRNMKQLTGLRIYFDGMIENDGSSKVDRVMLGIPNEVIRALEFLESFVVKGEQEPGIVNLTELEILKLWTTNWDIGTPERQRISLISDIFFDHAVSKMPKLRVLNFCGKFKPSDEMQNKWTEQKGRVITYTP